MRRDYFWGRRWRRRTLRQEWDLTCHRIEWRWKIASLGSKGWLETIYRFIGGL